MSEINESNQFEPNQLATNQSILKSLNSEQSTLDKFTAPTNSHSYGIHQTSSSIAPATKHYLSIENRIIKNQMNLDEIYNREITSLSDKIDSLSQQREELGATEITAMEKQAVRVNKESTVTSIINGASYLGFTASCAIGLTAGLPPIIAGVVLTSGVVGLANRFFSDFNLWESTASYFYPEKEDAREVANTIDQSLSISASWLGVLGVAGGATLGSAGLLGLYNSNIIKYTGFYGSSLFSAATTYNLDTIKKEIEEGNVEFLKIEGQINRNRKNQEMILAKNDENTKNNSSLLDKIMRFLKQREDIKRKLSKQ